MFDQEDLEQEFDLEDEEVNEALKQEEEVKQEEVKPEPEAKEPAAKMHISKEDWIAQGRDPELWVPPEVFKERTQRINETSKLKQENARLRAEREEDARRLTNVAFLQQQQITRLRAELNQKLDDAMEIGDKSAARALMKDIKDLDTEESLIKEPPKQTYVNPPEVDEWNAENDWLTPDHPLQPIAQEVYLKAINDGKTIAGALRMVDKELAKRRQDEPAQRKVPNKSIVDSPSRGTVSRSDSVTIRFEECSREEKDMYNEFYKPAGASMKDFLKDVSIARKGN